MRFCTLFKAAGVVLSLSLAVPALAQTAAEREKIKAGYNRELARAGKGTSFFSQEKSRLQLEAAEATERVVHYLKTRPGQTRAYTINGKPFFIQDIREDGTPIIITTKDRETGDVIKSGSLYSGGSLGLNISGQNMTAGVWDAGRVRTTHELFQNRAVQKDGAATLDNHMCHVAGDLMGGDIAANPAARGIAFNALAWCYDWTNDNVEYSQFGTDGYLVSNHSYGRGNIAEPIWSFGAYDNTARSLDVILSTRPNYLQVWAGGNEQQTNNNRPTKSGYDVMTGTSVSKNILCVGAVNANGTMSNFSNWGPTDDGRIKPDIVAKGVSMTSAYSSADNQYNTGNGTSYAAPSISGLAILLQQYYKTLNPDYLEAAGVRGLMMHTATDLGNPGPDYQFGWGMANGEKASQTIMLANADLSQTNSETKISKITTNPAVGSSLTYTVKAKGGMPLSVSIAWTDDAGTVQTSADGIDPTTARLVYDFDVKITAPDGTTTFYPWSGPGMANRTANATRTGVNSVDIFERVDIDNPIADGVYTITVTKTAGPVADRSFTLIATGLRNTAPEINFSQPTLTAAEATSGTTAACVNYVDYTYSLTIANAPTGTATVTIDVDGSSTAMEGKNFDVTTNGTFGAGSSKTLTFASGSAAAQSYTVRVYDDAVNAADKQIVLSFTTTGGDATVGKSAKTTIITIADNDKAAVAALGNTTGTTSAESGPSSRSEADVLMDHYFTAAELTAAGLVANSTVTALTLNVSLKQTTSTIPGFNIRLGHVSAAPTTTSAFINAASYTTCYSGSLTTKVGDNTFAFSTPFVWNGIDNIAVRYCFNGTADRSNTDFDRYTTKADALGAGINCAVVNYEAASANADGCALPTNTYVQSTSRPVTSFTFTKTGTAIIETAAAGTKTENLNAATGMYQFFSAGNKLIAGVSSPSLDGGCTEAKIEAAGTGFRSFNGGQLSNKVWKITPSANASTISYTVTLYMTTAELNGQDPSALRVFKSSAADVASMNNGNTTAAATTVTTFPGYVSFTASFTGFSLFAVGTPSATLPLQWIAVNGTINAQKQARIQWQVAESNMDKYVVEKSLDNRSYTSVGMLTSQGTGSNSYQLTDAALLNGTTYYRIKQVDRDGRTGYSKTLKLNGSGVDAITLYPNPVKDVVQVSVPASLTGTKASLMDAAGRRSKEVVIESNVFELDMSNLQPGIYLLKFNNDVTRRITKQ